MAEIRSFTRQGKRAKAQQETFFDYTLLFIVLFLLGFGLVMLYSTSSYDASLQYDGDSAYFLKKQLFSTILGLVAMMVVANIPYYFWKRFANLGYAASVVLILLIIVAMIVLSILIPNFLSVGNIFNLLTQASIIGLPAIGLTFIIVTAGIDLSLSTNMACSAILGCIIMRNTQNVFLGVLSILAIAIVFGCINGFSVAKLKMVPMIVTLPSACKWFSTKAMSMRGGATTVLFRV